MKIDESKIFMGDTLQKQADDVVRGEFIKLMDDSFYKINNYNEIEPFFMSLISSSDHWLFVSSTGGLSAGRGNAEKSLFPYYTVDKITENSENTGNKAILLVQRLGKTCLWEPFSERQKGNYSITRNLYKNVAGTTLIFEECNFDLGIIYRYSWRTSEQFGFVKSTWLKNIGNTNCKVELLDGLQNILPANIDSNTQNIFSPLLDAYKRSELVPETGLAIFALNSTLTDLAEPSESLLSTTVVQVGLNHADYLLSSNQLDRFRYGKGIVGESDVRGRRGSYFVHTTLDLAPDDETSWHIIADIFQDSTMANQKIDWLKKDIPQLFVDIETDMKANQSSLWKIVASADGIQLSDNQTYCAYHFSNVLFNLMRGGIFTDSYWISRKDFVEFVTVRNCLLLQNYPNFFSTLPVKIHISDLQALAVSTGESDLIRMSFSFLPLTFSRRHGDPSRPWNRFSINIKNPDGSQKVDYEGNWRDIFQNWEALAYSYPEYIENMVSIFLNATTPDGYNPYRISQQGVDWELPQPNNPWANIGYWSDHQIIYLQKLLEINEKVHPGKLQEMLGQLLFSYSNVPYRIKSYSDLLKDPFNSIEFDWNLQHEIESRRNVFGTDGNCVFNKDGHILHVSLAEKLLTLLLAKLTNFVPEGGIWMNTQRPEWNDANNALVGKGLSVVTLCYLRRYIVFCKELFDQCSLTSIPLNSEVRHFFNQIMEILKKFLPILESSYTDEQRRNMVDALGAAGSDYRWNIYHHGFSGELSFSSPEEIGNFLELAQHHIDHTLLANKRADNLFHSYNILHLDKQNASIGYLYEMLEGQVAILSSGLLSGAESLALLQSLRKSSLYRSDQNSYILYPDRNLPGFLQKNCLTPAQVHHIALFEILIQARDNSIITQDIHGNYHFSGHIRNFHDVGKALIELRKQPQLMNLVDEESEKIKQLFEETFHHNEFTGRSGTFFAYEGLGSIYWHMVAKLLLAVQETAIKHADEETGKQLRDIYFDIREGLSFNKTPEEYGAFPTDPYSHTPKGQGAKQPGMTGMVKEIILTRLAELGLFIKKGRIIFDPTLVDPKEFLTSPSKFTYLDVHGKVQEIDVVDGSLAYTICQIPVVLEIKNEPGLVIHFSNEKHESIGSNILDEVNSQHVFKRDGIISRLTMAFPLVASSNKNID